jgi:uncharacterized RDD family membrane protein YckC
MTTLIVETPEGVELRQELAGAGSRLAAGLLDLLFFGVIAAALGLLLLGLALLGGDAVAQFAGGLYVGGILLLGIAYPFTWSVLRQGQTPGKRLNALRVTAADGSSATALQHLVRALILPIDLLLAVPLSLGLLLMCVTPRHTRLGDLAAGTVVLRLSDPARTAERWPTERWSGLLQRKLLLTPADAARLSPADLAWLHDVVTREGIEPDVRSRLEHGAVSAFAARLGFAPPAGEADVAEALRELYLFAREHAAAA